MEQGMQEGSLRNSHREQTQVRRKPAPRPVQAAARALVEQCSQNGVIIRQHLDVERMKQPLQKGVFYVIENDSKSEPGFLVFLPKQPPVFMQTRQNSPPPCTLRMRVSPQLGDTGGSVFVATLDSIQHTLRIEDVWRWKGANIYDSQPYSVRRRCLQEFVEKLWIPDARLMGGIVTKILNPISVDAALKSTSTAVFSMEFIPEAPGRRRMWTALDSAARPALNSGATALDSAARPALNSGGPALDSAARPALNSGRPALNSGAPANVARAPVAPAPVSQRAAIARPVDKMPDIYDLHDETGQPFGRASVQRFSLSQQLRNEMVPAGVPVIAKWNSNFGGFEIVEIKSA